MATVVSVTPRILLGLLRLRPCHRRRLPELEALRTGLGLLTFARIMRSTGTAMREDLEGVVQISYAESSAAVAPSLCMNGSP